MASIRTFDPLDVSGVSAWIRQTSSLRLLALTSGRGRGRLVAYTCKTPDVELEHDVVSGGGVLVGYYDKRASVSALMVDIADALESE